MNKIDISDNFWFEKYGQCKWNKARWAGSVMSCLARTNVKGVSEDEYGSKV